MNLSRGIVYFNTATAMMTDYVTAHQKNDSNYKENITKTEFIIRVYEFRKQIESEIERISNSNE